MKNGVPQRPILGPLLFIIHINYLPLTINAVSEPIKLVDDTSVVTSSRNFKDFSLESNLVLSHIIKWFAANNLVLNLDKTSIMKLITNNHVLHYILVTNKSI